MRSTITKATALVAAAALSLTLAACGGSDGDVEAFCEDWAAMEADAEELFTADMQDEESTQAAIESLRANIASISAPEEIATEWSTLEEAFETLADAMEVLVDDPENMDAFMGTMEAMSDEDYAEAGDRIEAYVAENCNA